MNGKKNIFPAMLIYIDNLIRGIIYDRISTKNTYKNRGDSGYF